MEVPTPTACQEMVITLRSVPGPFPSASKPLKVRAPGVFALTAATYPSGPASTPLDPTEILTEMMFDENETSKP